MFNGFSWNSPKFLINQKLMLVYLKFYLREKKCGMTYGLEFVEANLGQDDVETDAKGGSHANTSCLNNCSHSWVAWASLLVAIVWTYCK